MSKRSKSPRPTYSRREFVRTTALAGAFTLAAPYVKTAYSAGRLSFGLWDHWVPAANPILERVVKAWGKENNVEVKLDFITSIGFKNLLTAQAEARAEKGHDIMAHPTWQISVHRDKLEPMNDVVERIEKEHGPFIPSAHFLAKFVGVWRAVPAPTGSHTYPIVSRLDLFKKHAGIDLQEIFPANDKRDPAKVASWNYDNFLEAVTKLNKAGFAFGNPIGPTSDSQDWIGPLFASFGAQMVDKDGNIAVDSDETRAALDYMQRLTAQMPKDVYAWDDAGNNRWIISGRGSSIQNPPSAWAVAKRDKPEVAEQLWHHDTPAGPAGRFRGSLPYFWGIWKFATNKEAAKDLIVHLARRDVIHKLLNASQGYDMPLLPSYYDNKVWSWATPPAGVLYNYPVRGDEQTIVTGYPAPPPIATQIYTQAVIPTLVAKVTQGGEAVKDAIDWAQNELEGFQRG